MTAHTGLSSDYDDDDEDSIEEIDFRNDPVLRLAKTMLEETPVALPGIKGYELLIEGIVIRLSFTETPRDHHSDSETDEEYDGRYSVRLEGQPKPQ